jgi:DNA mismatch repair ATPase MutL
MKPNVHGDASLLGGADFPGQIVRLSHKVASQIRSGCAVNSLATVVQELVENSIDSGATRVCVRVDASRLAVEVEDNGCGIPCASFPNLAARHCTSKVQSADNSGPLGYRGEALASIAEVSVLEVCAKNSEDRYLHFQHHYLRSGVKIDCSL